MTETEKLVAEFLARGGKINQFPERHSGVEEGLPYWGRPRVKKPTS